MICPIRSITPLIKKDPRPKSLLKKGKMSPSDLGLWALGKMSSSEGALHVTANSSEVILRAYPRLAFFRLSKKRAKRAFFKKTSVPIGLLPIGDEGEVNALMQLILAVPGFVESFEFVSKSFIPFQHFIDRYCSDQSEKKRLALMDTRALFSFFQSRLYHMSLEGMLSYLIKALGLQWGMFLSLEEAMAYFSKEDFFIVGSSTQRQVFGPRGSFELGAFIEHRQDDACGSYIAFVKCGGVWYQCDNERISIVRSNLLTGSLQRSTLLYYKKIDLCSFQLNLD